MARSLRTDHSQFYARPVADPEGHAAYARAVEEYQALLAEWEQRMRDATSYSDVCLKLTKGATKIPRFDVISALGELSPLAAYFLCLLFRCRRRAARVVVRACACGSRAYGCGAHVARQ